MKKLFVLTGILTIALVATAFMLPHKLPASMKTQVYNIKQQLGLNTHVVSHEKTLYKNTKKDGTVEFSDIQDNGVKHTHSNNGNFITMESAIDKEDTPYDLPEGATGAAAVLDPINSINSEAAKSVQKMREEKAKQMAEQGL